MLTIGRGVLPATREGETERVLVLEILARIFDLIPVALDGDHDPVCSCHQESPRSEEENEDCRHRDSDTQSHCRKHLRKIEGILRTSESVLGRGGPLENRACIPPGCPHGCWCRPNGSRGTGPHVAVQAVC